MLNTAIVVGVVVVVVVKRVIGEPLNARDLLAPPLVLLALGGYELSKLGSLRPIDLAWVAGGALAGVGFGVVRGMTVRLFVRNGVLCQRYTWWTFVAWAVTAALSAGVALLAAGSGVPDGARPITTSLGAGLLGELIVIGPRALRTGTPFAPRRSGEEPSRARSEL